MGFRALTRVHLGNRDPVEPGETIPEHFVDVDGESKPVDFDRLIELGAAEKAAGARKAKASEDPPADPPADDPPGE